MRDITLCHPRLQRLASAWMKACATHGITVVIGETFRTVAEQDALYAQGRTKPGKKVTNAPGSSYSSQHQWGIAFDFYLKMDIDGDGSTSDDAFNDSTGMFKKAAETAKAS
ncbi:M15 family peptidase, partial [Clostridium sp. AM48-13]|uniref:M15 family metallopeptidase n=1 Tax=Clostridium sp. AM48-13 TaxID=2293034 RepID=UPI000FF4EE76